MFLSEFELLFLKPLWSVSDFCFPQAPWVIEGKSPPEDWPSKGELEFVNYSVRYRKGLDLVLKGLNLQVHGGEKVSYQLCVFARPLLLGFQWQPWRRGQGLQAHLPQWWRPTPASSDTHAVGVAASSRLEAVEPIAWGFLAFPS